MPQHKDRRSSKSRLSVWTTVFFHSVIILQLTQINAGESLTNNQYRMLAVIGQTQDIVLPCKLDHPMDVVDEMVEWSRSDLNPRFVHVWRSGEDHLVGQNPSYKNRTSVSTEKLKTGDVSLKITKVRLSDEGTYRCFIPGRMENFSVELVVEADIEITEVSPGVLECKSKGWYPEPEVFWLENEGKIISAGSKEILRGPDDLYVLSSRLTLEKGHSNNITCRIQQNNQYRGAKIHVPDALSARSTIAGLIAGVVFIIFVAFLVWKWRKYNMETKKCSNDGESQSGSMDKSCPSVIESEKEPLLKQDKVEVNDTAHVSTEPESSCQNEVEKEYDIANKNIPQTTKSGTQQNNNQPGRETANDLYRNDKAQSGNGRQAQPEQFENNTKTRKDEIPNQSLMDDSGQEHHPKQGQEAKNDTSTEENKNKTQTINDETAPQSASAEEGKQSKCQHSNSGVNVYINGEKNPPTSQESGTNQNQIGSDVAANASETPAKKPDSEESQLEKTTVMSEGQEEEQLRKSSDAKSIPEDEKKDSNEDETQTTNNETADSANKDISQGGNPKENTEKDSDSKAGAQPSDPEVSTTNQKKPGKGLTSVEKIQSGKSTTEDQSEQQELSTEEGEIENDAEEAQDTEVD